MVVSISKRIGFFGWIVAIGFCLGFFPLRQTAAQLENPQPEEPNVLKAGGPLQPMVTATRHGKILQLGYSLRDRGGESYVSYIRGKLPQFAVYQGGKQIAAGAFEYG